MNGFLPELLGGRLVVADPLVPHCGQLRERVGGHRLAVLRRAADRLGARVAAAPDRPAALLVGAGREEAVLDLPVLAVEVEPLALERLLPDLDALEEASEHLLVRDAELVPVARVVPARHRRVEAALGEVVDDRELLGGVQRVVERRDERVRPDGDLVGLAGEDREQLLGPGVVALRPPVAVRDLQRVEARLLGDDPFLDHLLERPADVVRRGHRLVVRPLVDVDEVPDSHSMLLRLGGTASENSAGPGECRPAGGSPSS